MVENGSQPDPAQQEMSPNGLHEENGETVLDPDTIVTLRQYTKDIRIREEDINDDLMGYSKMHMQAVKKRLEAQRELLAVLDDEQLSVALREIRNQIRAAENPYRPFGTYRPMDPVLRPDEKGFRLREDIATGPLTDP